MGAAAANAAAMGVDVTQAGSCRRIGEATLDDSKKTDENIPVAIFDFFNPHRPRSWLNSGPSHLHRKLRSLVASSTKSYALDFLHMLAQWATMR